MFPVDFSYLDIWSLTSVPPIVLSSMLNGGGGGSVMEQHMVWSVSLGTLKLGNVNPEPWPQCFSRLVKSRFHVNLCRPSFLLDTSVKIRKIINIPQGWFVVIYKNEAKLAAHVQAHSVSCQFDYALLAQKSYPPAPLHQNFGAYSISSVYIVLSTCILTECHYTHFTVRYYYNMPVKSNCTI